MARLLIHLFPAMALLAVTGSAICVANADEMSGQRPVSCQHSKRNIFDSNITTSDRQPGRYVTAPGDIWFAGVVERTNRSDARVAFGYENGSGFQHGANDVVTGKGCIYFHFNPTVHEATANVQIDNFVSGDKVHVTMWIK